MEEFKTKAGDLTESITDYIQTYYKLAVLNVADKSTNIVASALAIVGIMFLGIFILLFSGIALAIWLGNLLDDAALGYLLVAALFLLMLIILVVLRKRFIFPIIRNQIINKLYERND